MLSQGSRTATSTRQQYSREAAVLIDEPRADSGQLGNLDVMTVVETDDGTIAFTDTDADGQADLMIQRDANGDVVGHARFDEVSGDWVYLERP
jgi:hypothetical protein